MKTLSYLLAAGIIFPSAVFSAELKFEDKTPEIMKYYGFSAQGRGFVDQRLATFEKVAGKSFEIELIDKGGVQVPYDTIVKLQDADNDTAVSNMQYPEGIVSWTSDNQDFHHPTYTFQVFAGGTYYYPFERSYQIELLVDGKSKGVTKTNQESNWAPTTYTQVPFNKDSTVEVIISALPTHTPDNVKSGRYMLWDEF